MSAVLKTLCTLSEYLTYERKATFKSLYYRGEIFAMAGGSYEHNLISANFRMGPTWIRNLLAPHSSPLPRIAGEEGDVVATTQRRVRWRKLSLNGSASV